jgi:hypothetical protein
MIQGESNRVVVKGRVGGGIVQLDWSMRQTGNHLLYIPNSQRTRQWISKTRVIPRMGMGNRRLRRAVKSHQKSISILGTLLSHESHKDDCGTYA